MLRPLLQILAFATAALVVIVGLFIAWWIALCVVLGVAAYLWVRRLLGRSLAGEMPGSGHSPVIIEGQYEVEGEAGPGNRTLDDRSGP